MSMLAGAPWLLAHKSMLEINKPLKVSLYGTDYVLWQDRTGKVNGLPNACPHMGAMLSFGWCQRNRIFLNEVIRAKIIRTPSLEYQFKRVQSV
nr:MULTISPECIES: Rieske 2Fe-2S domain-containing protein [unclassified Coleofasciculus]